MKLLLLFGVFFRITWGLERFDGNQVLRAQPRDVTQVDLLKGLLVDQEQPHKLDFWTLPSYPSLPVDIHVPLAGLRHIKAFLDSHNIQYWILIEDVQVLVDGESQDTNPQPVGGWSPASFNYSTYHPLETIYQHLDDIVAQHPEIVSKVKIGASYENRPLYVLKFSTGKGRRSAIWIDAGIHAREWITHATALWTAKKIAEDYRHDPSLASLLNAMDIFLMVVANPDGYVFSFTKNRLWRKTRSLIPSSSCVGVDPNRNWDAAFGGPGASSNPCSESYHGPYPNSEVEVMSIVNFVKQHRNIRAFITLHSYSQLLLYPYGYKCTYPEDIRALDTVGKTAVRALSSLYGTQYQVGPLCSTLYQTSGGSIDWAYEFGIKYSYAFELRDTGRYGFLLPAKQIIPTAQETWLALKTVMKEVRADPY